MRVVRPAWERSLELQAFSLVWIISIMPIAREILDLPILKGRPRCLLGLEDALKGRRALISALRDGLVLPLNWVVNFLL